MIQVIGDVDEFHVSEQDKIRDRCETIKQSQGNAQRRNQQECKHGIHPKLAKRLHPMKSVIVKKVIGLKE